MAADPESAHPLKVLIMRRAAYKGFTLIEVVIVAAVIAILASLAYPAYLEHVRRARRADARAVLLEVAQFMERAYSANGSYAGVSLPARLQTAPPGAATEVNYLISVSGSDEGYTITAKPTDADACGDLVLTHIGARTRTGRGLTDQDCWR